MKAFPHAARRPEFDNVLSRSDISALLSLAAGDPAVDPGALFFTLSLLNDLHEPADLQRAAILLFLAPEKRPAADPWVAAWAEGAERLRRTPLEGIPEALEGLPREALRLEAALRLASMRRQTAGAGPASFKNDAESPDAALCASPEGDAAERLGLWVRPLFIDAKAPNADSEHALARSLLRAQALERSGEPLAAAALSALIDIARAHPSRNELLPQLKRAIRIDWADPAEGSESDGKRGGRACKADALKKPRPANEERERCISPEERLIAAGSESPRGAAERDLTAFLRSIGVVSGRDAETGAIYVEEWTVKDEAFARLAASLACWLRPNFRVRFCSGPAPVPCSNFLGSFNRALFVQSRSRSAAKSTCPDPIEALLPGSGKGESAGLSLIEILRHCRL